VLAATILGSSLAFIDGTVVNVALPALQAGLGATVADVQWVIEAYALFFSALLLVGGSLGDRYGRRRVYALGVAVFAGASGWCGLAHGARELILARAVQGVGAALLVPGSLALIAATFPEQERGRAIGTWSGFSAMTTALGPALGGWLIDHLGWRWAFYVNAPIALAALVILFARVPESRSDAAHEPLDLAGAVLATLGLGGVVYGLIESSRLGWHDVRVVGALALGALATAAFFMVEARSKAPMLPLTLFRSRAFAVTNLLTGFLYGALAAALFVLPLNLIQVHKYSATAAGAALLPFIGILVAASRWSGGLVDRLGARLPLIVGPAISACGFALMARPGTSGSYLSTFFPALLVLGIGMAATVAPLTTTVMNAVPVARAGIASGINNAVSRAAGLIAIAVLLLPLQFVFRQGLDAGMTRAAIRPEIEAGVRSEAPKLAALEIPVAATPVERARIEGAVGTAFVAGFRFVAWAAASLALAGALVATRLPGRGSRTDPL
jgi:EmrB/QacA subfamily drug resistance transporter